MISISTILLVNMKIKVILPIYMYKPLLIESHQKYYYTRSPSWGILSEQLGVSKVFKGKQGFQEVQRTTACVLHHELPFMYVQLGHRLWMSMCTVSNYTVSAKVEYINKDSITALLVLRHQSHSRLQFSNHSIIAIIVYFIHSNNTSCYVYENSKLYLIKY